MVRSCLFVGVVALAACSFPRPSEGIGADADGGPDSDSAEPPRCAFTYADVCAFQDDVGSALTYAANTTINTSVATNCPHIVAPATGPALCVFYVRSMRIEQGITVRAIGTRPIAFITTEGITIEGALDASSDRSTNANPEVLGAGANSAACEPYASAPASSAEGGGGGGGASFSGRGGNGGRGDESGSNGSAGGVPAAATTDIAFVRGGCRGQSAGSAGSNIGGIGGPAGGAVYLASSEITIASSGLVLANGGAGRGGDASSGSSGGGGGGGSGGSIFLEAKLTHRDGNLVANGGGGGSGGFFVPSGAFAGTYPGTPGNDGTSSGQRANGGSNSLFPTGSGGDGSGVTARSATNGADSGDKCGGGGGGGAAGFIRILGPSDGAGVISPPL